MCTFIRLDKRARTPAHIHTPRKVVSVTVGQPSSVTERSRLMNVSPSCLRPLCEGNRERTRKRQGRGEQLVNVDGESFTGGGHVMRGEGASADEIMPSLKCSISV